ncbi:glutathione S-transferase family protein [Pseudomonadota bacterium]
MSRLQLIQAEVCPFAQRTHMCLLEKNLGFDCVEIDLDDKPDWFNEVSPYSKVPLLKDGNVLIYESTIINEYLNEVFPEPPLLPQAAADRATARTWIDFDNVKFVPAFYRLLLEQTLEKRQQLVDQTIEHMKFFEQRGFAADWRGPYWFGESISLADLAVYPHFERIAVLEHYRNIGIPDSCVRLKEWLSAMRERPSAQTTSHDDDYHVKAYAQYADGSASGSTAQDMLIYGH